MNLKELFDYVDGSLYWKKRPREHFSTRRAMNTTNSRREGKKAGAPNVAGYIKVKIDGKNYNESRLVFELHNGWCSEFIDHINGNKADNHIENLRPATKEENSQNAKRHGRNTSGVRGVSRCPEGWKVQVRAGGKTKLVRTFDDFEFACLVADEARRHYHGAFFTQRT